MFYIPKEIKQKVTEIVNTKITTQTAKVLEPFIDEIKQHAV